ncbi:hypothetical protein D3C83_195570 [compost metagenome]
MEPNDIGISSTAGDRLARTADCSATGSSMASAPTLFMKADSAAAIPASAPAWPCVVRVSGPM